MTPKEAADLVITCTALGLSGKPLWEYLPGMVFTWASGQARQRLTGDGSDPHVDMLAAMRARPDFTDDLTVQALYLLMRRAYFAAGHSLTVDARPDGKVRLLVVLADGRRRHDAGPAYAVFAKALAKAPRL